jgi:uncharacterized protein
MKRVFIVHGWDGNPDEAWLAWLRLELEKNNIQVVAPQMPNTGEPKIEEWVSYLTELVGVPNEETYFVGHSIGCQAIMRYLEKAYPQKVGGVIFVAGWFHLENLEGSAEEAIAKPWMETPIDLVKVKNSAKNILAIFSENDPFVPLADKNIFQKKLGAEIIVEKDKGHFTEDDGITQMPEVLEYILK